MPIDYYCPICKAEPGGSHKFDCHFTGMGRERAIMTFIPMVRLSPDGKTYLCDTCKQEWPCGQAPYCPNCGDHWDAIDKEFPHAD